MMTLWKCLVACVFLDESQHPTCPQIRHIRKWTQVSPILTHSSQTCLVGVPDFDLVEVRAFFRHRPSKILPPPGSSDHGHVTKGHNHINSRPPSLTMIPEVIQSCFVLIISRVCLTVASTILVGRRCWEGWALAGVNSMIICMIGLRTEQLGLHSRQHFLHGHERHQPSRVAKVRILLTALGLTTIDRQTNCAARRLL